MVTAVPVDRIALPVDDALADLYDEAPCGLLSTTSNGIVLKVNNTLARWLGIPAADLVGRLVDDVLDVGSRLIYRSRCLPSLAVQTEMREVALDLRASDGRSLSVLVNLAVRPEVDRVPRVIRMAVFDVSNRQRYRSELLTAARAAERSEWRAGVLRQAATTFAKATKADELAGLLSGGAAAAFDAAASAVLLLSDDGTELRLAAGDHPTGPVLPLSAGGPETAAMEGRTTVFLGDLDAADAAYPGLADLLTRKRFAAMSVVPLCSDDAAVGVLVCFFGRLRHVQPDELELGNELAQQAVLALQRIEVETRLSYRAQHDLLTGLANRELLLRELTAVLKEAERQGRPMALLFLDLDGFKPINDAHGHPAGDAVLVATAHRLREAVRQHDIVSRIGGDEFVVVCADVDHEVAMVVARRIALAVKQPVGHRTASYVVTGSIGVAVRRPGQRPAVDAEELFAAADAAMYRSKAAGKDAVTLTICGSD